MYTHMHTAHKPQIQGYEGVPGVDFRTFLSFLQQETGGFTKITYQFRPNSTLLEVG